MKSFYLILLLTITSPYCYGLPQSPLGEPLTAIKGLVERVLGEEYIDKFQYEVIDPDYEQGADVYEVGGSTIPTLRGNNGVALASALNYYLKYYCNCSISWGVNGSGDQLRLPNPLPVPEYSARFVSPVKYRYYQNVCTVSYSMVWWDFKRWEREIDWMALNGINLPLSFTGQEVVWQKLYTKLRLTNDEIKAFFSGPAFLAWQRMGNIKGWGGPLDDDWIARQGQIQSQIVQRVRLFGMFNVLPGFSGHVPGGIQRLYPEAQITRNSQWNRFNSTYTDDYLLEPMDPLFMTLGKEFYKLLIAEYGTDHIYNTDTYNEMDPSSSDPDFLANTNKVIYDTMAAVDSEAVFLMQGWLFHADFWNNTKIEAFLSKVPNDKMIILDLNSEDNPVWSLTQSYFGKPFIWCLLHNYGGTRGIYGSLDTVATGPVSAKRTPGNTMIGTGITPEAIEHNPVIYDLMGEMGWRQEEVDVNTWLKHYAARRYGGYSTYTESAWSILHYSAYNHHFSGNIKSIVDRGPGMDMTIDTAFNTTGIVDAWMLLYQAAKSGQIDSTVGPFQYDLVDIGRQCLTNLFYDMYRMFTLAYDKFKNNGIDSSVEMETISNQMKTLLKELDEYLGTNVNFLLGNWIEAARNSSSVDASEDVKNNLEFNARNQITMWGPNQNIEDYASKEWSGLINDYYLVRWTHFFKFYINAVKNNEPANDDHYEAGRFEIENKFSNDIKTYPTQPTGDVMKLTGELLERYLPDFKFRYTEILDTDVTGHNLYGQNQGPWTRNLFQVAYLCDINPTCKGFTTEGYLKNSTSDQTSFSGVRLYIKI